MISEYHMLEGVRTVSSNESATASWSTVHKAGYLPMAGVDRFRFSTSLDFRESPPPRKKPSRRKKVA